RRRTRLRTPPPAVLRARASRALGLLEGERAPVPAHHRHVDPQDGQVLDQGGIAQGTGVDGPESRLGRDLGEHLLGLGVVAREEDVGGNARQTGVLVKLRTECVEALDYPRAWR